jgi:hypothetical protein
VVVSEESKKQTNKLMNKTLLKWSLSRTITKGEKVFVEYRENMPPQLVAMKSNYYVFHLQDKASRTILWKPTVKSKTPTLSPQGVVHPPAPWTFMFWGRQWCKSQNGTGYWGTR